MEGTGRFGCIAPVENRAADLNHLGEFDGHAHLAGNRGAHFIGTCFEASDDFVYVHTALFHAQRRPGRKSRTGSQYSLGGFFGRTLGNGRHDLFGGGVVNLKYRRVMGLVPSTVDVMAVVSGHANSGRSIRKKLIVGRH